MASSGKISSIKRKILISGWNGEEFHARIPVKNLLEDNSKLERSYEYLGSKG